VLIFVQTGLESEEINDFSSFLRGETSKDVQESEKKSNFASNRWWNGSD
jgi:hypothetical protein